jgi:hypothetical protein
MYMRSAIGCPFDVGEALDRITAGSSPLGGNLDTNFSNQLSGQEGWRRKLVIVRRFRIDIREQATRLVEPMFPMIREAKRQRGQQKGHFSETTRQWFRINPGIRKNHGIWHESEARSGATSRPDLAQRGDRDAPLETLRKVSALTEDVELERARERTDWEEPDSAQTNVLVWRMPV